MAKTILVPTDFSIDSLSMVKNALERNSGNPLKIIFAVGIHLPDGIVETLFFSRHKVVDEMITKEFSEACEIIRNRYSSGIREMRVEPFSGFTQAAFRNFTDANGVDEMYYPTSPLHMPGNAFDLVPFIRKARLPQFEVSGRLESSSITKNSIAQLFTNWN
jgi:hypothetical protein